MFVMLSVHTHCSVHERQKVETTTNKTATTATTITSIIPILRTTSSSSSSITTATTATTTTTETIAKTTITNPILISSSSSSSSSPSSSPATNNNINNNNNYNFIIDSITKATTKIPQNKRTFLTTKLGTILLSNKYNNNYNNNNNNHNIIKNTDNNNNKHLNLIDNCNSFKVYNNSTNTTTVYINKDNDEINYKQTNLNPKTLTTQHQLPHQQQHQQQQQQHQNLSIIQRITKRNFLKSSSIFSKKSNYLPTDDTTTTSTELVPVNESELNNNRGEPTPTQVPVATILNDLGAATGVVKVKNKTTIFSMSPMTPKGLPSDTPDIKAMRGRTEEELYQTRGDMNSEDWATYYRLWIYTCNAVLLMGVIIFCGVAGKVLIADYRRILVNDLNLGQPSFIYAYLALLVQSGFLQLIGCLGALRLSEKLLNAYWLLLLLLLIGDVLLGIFWLFKFDRIMETFEPILRNRFNTEYGFSNEFSDLWDRLQNDGKCCGIIGPQDFTNKSYPASCCTTGDITDQISVSRRPLASAVVFRNDDLSAQQKQNLSDIADSAWSHVVSESRGSGGTVSVGGVEPTKNTSTCRAVFPLGCRDFIASWLRSTADILFVIGYCVIAFLKLSFLGILRYEIREMIQKIKLLQNETAAAILEQELDQNQLTQVTSASINGGLHTEPKVGNRDRERSRMSSGESERESLLIHENTPPNYLRHKHLYGCTDFGGGGGGGGNSGGGNVATNAAGGAAGGGGAGIDIEEPGPSGHYSSGARSKTIGTHANDTECPLIVEDASASAAAAAKLLNISNNYELTEFDTKAPTYRRVNAGPTVTKM